ncbi:MAG: hypothetical protein AAF806_10990 [Bacteroidota bacterium]
MQTSSEELVNPTPRKQNFDRSDLIALLALFISVLGTIVAFRETSILSEEQQLNQRNQAASVWPYLDTKYSYNYQDSIYSFVMVLENKGVGPALLNKADLIVGKDTIQFSQVANYLSKERGDDIFFQVQSTNIGAGILSAGEEVQLFEVTAKERLISFQAFQTSCNEFKINLCYCSIYQDCWKYNAGSWATATEDCEIGATIY